MITPQQARALLDGDFSAVERVDDLPGAQPELDPFGDTYLCTTPGDKALIDAAPELARTVAGMRYEYAVQEPVATLGDPVWRFVVRISKDGGAILTAWPRAAKWFETRQAAGGYIRRHGLTGHRIVRRLASDVEVVS